MEVGYANAHGWGCESESDWEGRLNEMSDRWKAFCHGAEAMSENEGESDIVDAKEDKSLNENDG